MKIAILTPTCNYYSGIDRVVEQQAKDYAKKGNNVTVIALEAKIKTNRATVKIFFFVRYFLLDSRVRMRIEYIEI